MDESQFTKARKIMVDSQIRPNKVTDLRVLEAFGEVPREAFVGKHQRAIAYIDEDLSLPGGRYIMEPMISARIIQALHIRPSDNVLVVGGGTGYGAAILARLAASVIIVESRAQLVEKCQETLVAVGLDNAVAVKSRLADGFAKEAPYDRILIEGAVESVPDGLLQQLSADGLLAAIWRPQDSPVGLASLWSRAGSGFSRKSLFDAQVPLLDEFRSKREFVF
ncbi:protein-L-isoaspartate O-methyltransferase [Alphaproteobacteria bacterium]|jgi:protein-L-isoaspartate(D-aspartate) O-methyltransferase|nr:protein-L-isoaspartate O-methyltransferase [Alphaproteobacteria bacterium]